MRRHGIYLVSAATMLLGFGLVLGQAPGGGKGRFGGPPDPIMLLHNPQVKKELELTGPQLQAIQPAAMKAVASVLNETQMKRFRQIRLQMLDNGAFAEGQVRKRLKLSAEQIQNLDAILADARKERADIARTGGKTSRIKLEGLRKETHVKIISVLNAEQKQVWERMRGPEFKPGPRRGPEK